MIAGAAPRAVAVDVIFAGRGRLSDDEKLIAAIRGPLRDRLSSRPIGSTWAASPSCSAARARRFLGDTSTPAVAYAGFPIQRGGVIRRIERSVVLQMGAHSLATFAVATTRVGVDVAPRDLPARAWIDYRGPPGDLPADRARGRASAEPGGAGAAARQARDPRQHRGGGRRRPSHGGARAGCMAGIKANAVATALDRFRLRDGGKALDLALIVALGLLPAGLALLVRPRYLGPAALVAAALFCVGAQLAFGAGLVVSVVFPIAALLLATLGVITALMLRSRSGARAAAPLADAASSRSTPPSALARERLAEAAVARDLPA